MPITFEALWAQKYAPLFARLQAEEAARQAEDFIDVPRTVCGLPLRAITPRDLLYLDYIESPFIRGGEIRPAHIPQFLFALHAAPPRWWWQTRKFFRHCATLDFAQALGEIDRYCERIFADQEKAPGSGTGAGDREPLGTHFLASLIVRIGAGMPSLGPAEIMSTPLPQLFQYEKVLAAEEAARDPKGRKRHRSPHRKLLSDCLAEVDALNRAEAEAAATPPPDSPPAA